MKFEVLYDKQPKKFLKKLNKHQILRILEKINILIINPVPHDAKSIVGEHNIFRIRIGNLRVLYRLNYEKKIIIIFNIDNREKVYQ